MVLSILFFVEYALVPYAVMPYHNTHSHRAWKTFLRRPVSTSLLNWYGNAESVPERLARYSTWLHQLKCWSMHRPGNFTELSRFRGKRLQFLHWCECREISRLKFICFWQDPQHIKFIFNIRALWFKSNHSTSNIILSCKLERAAAIFLWCKLKAMSSAYWGSLLFNSKWFLSFMYWLKRIGQRVEPWGCLRLIAVFYIFFFYL